MLFFTFSGFDFKFGRFQDWLELRKVINVFGLGLWKMENVRNCVTDDKLFH